MTTELHPNGRGFFLPPTGAQGLAHYPHARTVPVNPPVNTLYVSGTSSRRGDGSYAGYSEEGGIQIFNVKEQTKAVLKNIETIIRGATDDKCGLEAIADATIFLVNMSDYQDMNAAWNEAFPDARSAPARTCVAVAALPSPKLVVEIKCLAMVPATEFSQSNGIAI